MGNEAKLILEQVLSATNDNRLAEEVHSSPGQRERLLRSRSTTTWVAYLRRIERNSWNHSGRPCRSISYLRGDHQCHPIRRVTPSVSSMAGRAAVVGRVSSSPRAWRRTASLRMLALMGRMSRAMLERYSHIRMAAKVHAVSEVRFRAEQTKWSWRRDLNPRPSDYKSDALPTELRQRL